jgi:D-aminoacyl-tRNA deacylase
MRVVLQRVREASVVIQGELSHGPLRLRGAVGGHNSSRIGRGLLVLAGFEDIDGDDDLDWMAGKIVRMRLFADDAGVMNRSVQEVDGEILAVSQFTLYASVKKGNRPSWSRAARGDVSQPMFQRFVAKLARELGKPVASGVFGADMLVSLVNDGPVTVCIDSRSPE